MRIAFVNYNHFGSNSAVHIFSVANELVEMGHECWIVVPERADTVRSLGHPLFQPLTYSEALEGRELEDLDLIHAWTPRERVRLCTESLVRLASCPYVVHLEDNEEYILAEVLDRPVPELKALSDAELDRVVPPGLAHPRRYRAFLEGAAGATVLIDRLAEFVPRHLPCLLFWPSHHQDRVWARPVDDAFRQELGLDSDATVLAYPGNVHAANRREVADLYLATFLLNRRGQKVRLVRAGTDYVPLLPPELDDLRRRYCVELGSVEHSAVPSVLSLADVLVQPGTSDAFNDYRFPSKLPEFLATGRAVILPRANIGREMQDGVNCVLLNRGDAMEVAQALERLIGNREHASRIGKAGQRFCAERLDWTRSAAALDAFYHTVLQPDSERRRVSSDRHYPVHASRMTFLHEPTSSNASVTRAPDPLAPDPLTSHPFPGHPELSYATVRDYADSLESLPELASAAQDLKDVQRPWTVKAVQASVRRGGHLLEIGAGEPLVAAVLHRMGYEVTIVDPYDGSGNGPREFEIYREQYPQLHFERALFGPETFPGEQRSFDAIYSVSVLEHVPEEAVNGIAAAMRRLLKAGGFSIHAIDHVYLGRGSEWHVQHLRRWTTALGGSTSDLETLLSRVETDPEVFFLSPYGHCLWKGAQSYDEFPMRRCISVQYCLPAAAMTTGLTDDSWGRHENP